MRWAPANPEAGDIKIVSKFLLIPRRACDGKYIEWRWLETATMKYRYRSSYRNARGYWELECFV